MPFACTIQGIGALTSLNTVNYLPVFVDLSWTIDRMAVWINSNVASAVLRVGLYDNTHASGMAPGSLIEEFGTIDCSTGTGTYQTVTPATGSRTLSAGIYWLGYASQGASANVQRGSLLFNGSASAGHSAVVTPAPFWAESASQSGALPSPTATPVSATSMAVPLLLFRTA